jgi:Rab-GTPase-TBC domain
MPKFFSHLRKIQMTPDYFTSKWFMTIFACFLPYNLLPPIFDMFITEGWKAVFRIGIALLKQLESELVSKDMMEVSEYFRVQVRHQKLFDPSALFSSAQQVRVNNILVN